MQRDGAAVTAPAFAGGFLLAVANPKAYLAITAVFAASTLIRGAPVLDAVLKTALLVFAGVAVLVGGFLIFNTFAVTVAQRSREFALLRTLGASRRQVLNSVVVETLIIGVIASILGILGGLVIAPALRALLSSFGIDLPTTSTVVETRTVIAGLLVFAVIAAIASQAGLGSISWNGKLMAPKASRINPASGLKRIFGMNGWIELLNSLLKVALLGSIGGYMLWGLTDSSLGHVAADLPGAVGQLWSQLITLLFNGFMDSVALARGAMRSRQIEAKGKAIGRTARIVEEGLKAGLNLKDGGKLAEDLDSLYAYVALRLTYANLKNDEGALDECARLIGPLRDAWIAIGPQVEANAP